MAMKRIAARLTLLLEPLSEKLIGRKGTLPPGPVAADAGKNDYPWLDSKAASVATRKPSAKKRNPK
jgi:hypothetical protein